LIEIRRKLVIRQIGNCQVRQELRAGKRGEATLFHIVGFGSETDGAVVEGPSESVC
jgi:hypothetical protein